MFTANEEAKSESDIYFDDSPSIASFNGQEGASSHSPSGDTFNYAQPHHLDFGPSSKTLHGGEDSERSLKDDHDDLSPDGQIHHHPIDQGSEQSRKFDFGHRKPVKSESLIAEPSHHSRHGSSDQHGWLDMGAYSGKHGAFGWYADFPVGGMPVHSQQQGYAAASTKQNSHHSPHHQQSHASDHSINPLG